MSDGSSSAVEGDSKNDLPPHAITPSDNDVLCGRGWSINTHPGNETYRKFVNRRKRLYLTARFKREKRLIAEGIVKEIRSLDPPGRFLARNNKTSDDWYDIGDEMARDKTNQALREKAPRIRKEIEEEKDAKRSHKEIEIEVETGVTRKQMRKEKGRKATAEADGWSQPDASLTEPPPSHPPPSHHGPPPSPAWGGHHGHHSAPPPHYGKYPATADRCLGQQQAMYPPPYQYEAYPPPPHQPLPHTASGNDDPSNSSTSPPKITSPDSNVPENFSFSFPPTRSSSQLTPGPQHPPQLPHNSSRLPTVPAIRKRSSPHYMYPPHSSQELVPHTYHSRPYSSDTANGFEDSHTLPHYGQDPHANTFASNSNPANSTNRRSRQLDPPSSSEQQQQQQGHHHAPGTLQSQEWKEDLGVASETQSKAKTSNTTCPISPGSVPLIDDSLGIGDWGASPNLSRRPS